LKENRPLSKGALTKFTLTVVYFRKLVYSAKPDPIDQVKPL